MRSFLLNKLVRDKIVPDMQQVGQKVTYTTLSDNTAYQQALIAKIQEEANELIVDEREAMLKELADVLEAVEAMATTLGADFDALRAVQMDRRAHRGAFNERLFVEKIDLADDDPWVDYYSNNPQRYKEVT